MTQKEKVLNEAFVVLMNVLLVLAPFCFLVENASVYSYAFMFFLEVLFLASAVVWSAKGFAGGQNVVFTALAVLLGVGSGVAITFWFSKLGFNTQYQSNHTMVLLIRIFAGLSFALTLICGLIWEIKRRK